MRIWISALLCLMTLNSPGLMAEAKPKLITMPARMHQFIQKYCIDCHGEAKQKGDRAFHQLAIRTGNQWRLNLSDEENIIHLEEMLDQLNLGEMPPRKKTRKGQKPIAQPATREIRQAIEWLTQTLKQNTTKETVTVMRRLNRSEYKNTMRDLLQLGRLAHDPTSEFPADDDKHGFKTIGDALNLTDAHLNAYLDAADEYLSIAYPPKRSDAAKTISLKPREWGYETRVPHTPWMYRLATVNKYLDIGAGRKDLTRHLHLATVPWRIAKQGGIRQSGYYRITMKAEAIRRLTHPYDPQMIPTDLSKPMQLGLYIADSIEGTAAGGVKNRKRIGLWDLKDHQQGTYEVTVWMNQGAIPFINWDNGPGSSDWWMRDICKKYHDDIEFKGKVGQGAHEWHIIGKNAVPGRVVSDVWQGPLLRLHEFKITGPISQSVPTIAHVDLRDFAARAFRQPVTDQTLAPYRRIMQKTIAQGRSMAEGKRLAMTAMLVSPDFLYLREDADASGNLTAYELANRLSYMLWRSMPDQLLMASASDGSLLKPEVLRSQAQRLLKDRRSREFIKDFADSWLRLDKLGTMPPDKTKFRTYYLGLSDAMRQETLIYIEQALKQNRPIREFLDSDYTYANQILSRHYGLEEVQGIAYRRVKLPANSGRGGLLGHASILTLTANGVDTSPIIRGIWILENLLGTPPAPPPPDVEPLEPDTRGSKSLKARLIKHRTVEACADCHNKIDPLGFPLENYDPIGGYRNHYPRGRIWRQKTQSTRIIQGAKVDPIGTLASGEQLRHFNDLKRYLLSKEPLFARMLVEKLLTFGTGREMTVHDHEAIQNVVTQVASRESKFQDLLLGTVTSKTFRKK